MSHSLHPYLNTVTHGDCIAALRALPDESVDLVLTDPPYLVRYRDRNGRSILNDDNCRWIFPAFFEMYRVLKPNSLCVSFYGWPHVDRFMTAWRECGFTPVSHLTWVKPYVSKVGFTQGRHECAYLLAKGRPCKPLLPPADVLDWEFSGNASHPNQKPVLSLVPLIEAYSKPDDVVLDPFAGSGSTGIAALSCQRRFILIEKDARYAQAAKERIREYAELVGAA